MGPYGASTFSLEVFDGFVHVEVANFLRCEGLSCRSEVFEIVEGGVADRTHRRPGVSRWDPLVLTTATEASVFLLEWRDRHMRGGFGERVRTSGNVALRGPDGCVLRRWHFLSAWPVAWSGPILDSMTSQIAVERLELHHDGLRVTDR